MRIHVKKWPQLVADMTQQPPAYSLCGILFTDHTHTHMPAHMENTPTQFDQVRVL